jgi:hypothetical protein
MEDPFGPFLFIEEYVETIKTYKYLGKEAR